MTDGGSAGRPARRPDWGAVGAIAGAVAAVVALVAYLVPPDSPPPAAAPVVTSPTPPPSEPGTDTHPSPVPTPVPTPEPDRPSPAPPRTPTPAPAWQSPLPTLRPGGCDTAEAALAAYGRNAGGTRTSQAAAASQAYQDLMGAGLEAQGAVGGMIRGLAAEFSELNARLTGMVLADPNEVVADINRDVPQLRRLCD
ncbi:hypothetical protein [Kitasatospora sp. NPDC094011]|uniref:hypothetical protein n=1 Tax=Kitasatospora sp. NPDC094011 TaxID=3364090 RepID=UPI00382D82C9